CDAGAIAEILVLPIGAARFPAALDMAAEIHRAAGLLADAGGQPAGVAEQGGWRVAADDDRMLSLAIEAIGKAGYVAGSDAVLALRLADSAGGGGTWSDAVLAGWLKRPAVASVDAPAGMKRPAAARRGPSGALLLSLGEMSTLSLMEQAV